MFIRFFHCVHLRASAVPFPRPRHCVSYAGHVGGERKGRLSDCPLRLPRSRSSVARGCALHSQRLITLMLAFFFAGFILLIIALVALDLGVLHRKDHVIGIREALRWTAVWVTLALIFNGLVYFLYGHNWLGFTDAYHTDLTGGVAAKKFLNGYLLELSLS